MPSDELLTVSEASSYLGIRPWTLRHWMGARKIEFVKYGNGAVRLKRSALDLFVQRCTIKANPHEAAADVSRFLDGTGLGSAD